MKIERVFVVGAGFSKSLGYPLSNEILPGVWKRQSPEEKRTLERIIKFHHPWFNPDDKRTFPNIERLLTDLEVNDEMFDASRYGAGNFTHEDLKNGKRSILVGIENWFHEIYENAGADREWLNNFKRLLAKKTSAIISFNWDLVLDHLLFGSELSAACYGLERSDGPVLLKPHGSLNWFGEESANHLKLDKRVEIFCKKAQKIYAFLPPRAPRSNNGHTYEPLLIPPTYLKKFDRPIFTSLWKKCTDVLSCAGELWFLGYSMPDEDRHTQFILRCGLHNQVDGTLRPTGERAKPTGRSKIRIVNPDVFAADRIMKVVGPACHCDWINERVEKWVEKAFS